MAISGCKWLIFLELLFLPGHSGIAGSLRRENPHPFYVSVTEINHNAKDQIIEVSCKIFTNDFETTLRQAFNNKLDLSAVSSKGEADKCIASYIPAHLRIKVNGMAVPLQYVGAEKENEATWSYFQVSNVSMVKKIDIVNTLLYESFSGEINIMHVKVNGNRKSTKLSNPESSATFEF